MCLIYVAFAASDTLGLLQYKGCESEKGGITGEGGSVQRARELVPKIPETTQSSSGMVVEDWRFSFQHAYKIVNIDDCVDPFKFEAPSPAGGALSSPAGAGAGALKAAAQAAGAGGAGGVLRRGARRSVGCV